MIDLREYGEARKRYGLEEIKRKARLTLTELLLELLEEEINNNGKRKDDQALWTMDK